MAKQFLIMLINIVHFYIWSHDPYTSDKSESIGIENRKWRTNVWLLNTKLYIEIEFSELFAGHVSTAEQPPPEASTTNKSAMVVPFAPCALFVLYQMNQQVKQNHKFMNKLKYGEKM